MLFRQIKSVFRVACLVLVLAGAVCGAERAEDILPTTPEVEEILPGTANDEDGPPENPATGYGDAGLNKLPDYYSFAASREECPHKIYWNKSIEGIFDGVEGDEYYAITLRCKDGGYFSCIAEIGLAERELGPHKGKLARVQYSVEQYYVPAEKRCFVLPIYKKGELAR